MKWTQRIFFLFVLIGLLSMVGQVAGQTAVVSLPVILRQESVIATVLVSRGATWHYYDLGQTPPNDGAGNSWKATSYNATSWPGSGVAPLGYGDSHIITTVSYGSNANNKYITTYFRHTFTVADPSAISQLTLSLLRDDGAVVYLNGTEVARSNMPSGSVGFSTLAATAVSTNETAYHTFNPNPALLVSGNNALAVEIHQSGATSSDLGFDLQLDTNPPSTFVQSIWSGAITTTSAKVNARITLESSSVRLVASQSANLSNPLYSSFVTTSLATNNNVAPLSISGLTPNAHYYYAIEANGVIDTSKIGQFTTFAAGPFTYTFAMAGDANLGSAHAVYTSIQQQNPLFFLIVGDFFYADIAVNDRNQYRAAFNSTLASATQSALYQQVPIAYVWDDHDYGLNNADSTAAGREAARLTYQEYVPHYPLAAGSGNVPIYQSFSMGRAKFIITDLRSERTPSTATDNASKTMMGATQKAWFKQQLLDANGTYPLIFVVGSVPWISSSGSDTWAGYTTERRELADFIKNNNIQGIVMLSADAHMLALDDGTNNSYATGGGASFPVFHAAALDRTGSIKGGPYTHGPFAGTGQFALITVTDAGGSQICVQYRGLQRDSGTGNLNELIIWSTCYGTVPTAVAPIVIPTLNVTTPTTLDLTWSANAANCSYEIHSATAPYFAPTAATLLATTAGTTYAALLAMGDPGTNHFYLVRAVNCDSSSTAVSNHVGEFDFAIVPGSP